MYAIALIGGMGSGKSTAAALFKAHGVDVIDTDEVAHALTQAGTPYHAAIIEHFGTDFLQGDGELNRHALRDRIFKHPHDKTWLEQLLHPAIRRGCIQHAQHHDAPYHMFVIPLLYDRASYPVQRILLIDCPEKERIRRVEARSGLTQKQIKLIFAQQPSASQRQQLADDTIDNTQDLQHLTQAVAYQHRHYLKQAKTEG